MLPYSEAIQILDAARIVEPRRRDADDRHRPAHLRRDEMAADHRRIAAEAAPPRRVAEHDWHAGSGHWLPTPLHRPFGTAGRTPGPRRERRRSCRSRRPRAARAGGRRRRARRRSRASAPSPAASRSVCVSRRKRWSWAGVIGTSLAAPPATPDSSTICSGCLAGRRAKQNRLKDGEHRARHPDRESEDEHDGDAERGRSAQGARGVRQVASGLVEHADSSPAADASIEDTSMTRDSARTPRPPSTGRTVDAESHGEHWPPRCEGVACQAALNASGSFPDRA